MLITLILIRITHSLISSCSIIRIIIIVIIMIVFIDIVIMFWRLAPASKDIAEALVVKIEYCPLLRRCKNGNVSNCCSC